MSSIIGGTTGITFPDSTVQTTAATTPTAVANLSGGAAGVVPYQTGSGATSFTAAGTSGQVLTSAGTGTPTWSTPSAGAMTLISTLTASSTSSLQWTSLSGYNKYMLLFDNLVTNTACQIYLVMGSSGYTTSNYYQNSLNTHGSSVFSRQDFNSSQIYLTYAAYDFSASGGALGSVAGFNGAFNIFGFNSATNYFAITGASEYASNTTNNLNSTFMSGINYASTGPFNSLKIQNSAGNFVSGKISLYGISD